MKFIILLLSVALYCCGNAKEVANHQDHTEMKSIEKLSGTYRITSISNSEEIPEELSITFKDSINKVSGYSGCNNFFSNYTIEGNRIQFGVFGMTHRLCKRFMDVEQNMLKALAETSVFTVEDNVLSLLNSKETLLKANKIITSKIAQEGDYEIEYTANTRGFYTQVIIYNRTISIQKDREAKSPAEIRECSREELSQLKMLLSTIDVSKLSEYEGPTEKRFYDGAAMAYLKISQDGKEYKTPTFDHGYPNINIEALVNTITKMAKMP